ncbi:MAG: hypothetical protein C0506_03860 [Anaerolinea sp.]|nr:hypothetical protein [Anaerolinea sp.]
MDQQSSSHGDHGGEPAVHLPDPSVWPFIIGAASFAVGLALVWWSRDRNNEIAGPLLGATLLLTLIAGLGWAYEDGRMKRKAEEGAAEKPREARFTQVLTFAISEGRMDGARLSGGILDALERSDSALRDLPGFQDLRIIAAPAAVGPSQVLVETTWSNREGLATYEETRRTLLDMVSTHPDEVVPGSVQVFDMEVVRDTKPLGFQLSLGAAAALLGSLLVFGFMVGAGLNLFANESAASGEAPANGGTPPVANNVITATDNKFDKTTLEAPPNTKVTYELKNAGKVKHNIHFMDKAGGKTLADGAEGKIIDGGATDTLNFTTPAAGSYYFQCDLHPDTMKGAFVVKEGAPVPGAAAAGGAPAGGASAGGLAVVGTDNAFDKTKLEAAAGEVSIDFKNNGKLKHNLSVLDKKAGKSLAEGKIIDGGQTATTKFPAAAGSYYFQCDLHPDQMNGTITVK